MELLLYPGGLPSGVPFFEALLSCVFPLPFLLEVPQQCEDLIISHSAPLAMPETKKKYVAADSCPSIRVECLNCEIGLPKLSEMIEASSLVRILSHMDVQLLWKTFWVCYTSCNTGAGTHSIMACRCQVGHEPSSYTSQGNENRE